MALRRSSQRDYDHPSLTSSLIAGAASTTKQGGGADVRAGSDGYGELHKSGHTTSSQTYSLDEMHPDTGERQAGYLTKASVWILVA